MKKRFWILLAAVALAAAAGTVSAAAVLGEEEPAPPAEELREAGYTLMEYRGEIGVFREGELMGSAGVDVTTLRAADRELLRRGIQVGTYEEVLMLLEDFGS